jgi:hypothetical protein
MANTSTWDFARDTIGAHFTGVVQPLWFGHALTVDDQTRRRGKPRPSILAAIDLVRRLGGRTIVEIGCMRQPLTHTLDQFNSFCCNDGHSTAFWAASGLAVHSVDIDPAACRIAAETCADCPNVRVTCADGIEFLKAFTGTIDLLFLDAWDAVEGLPYAEKHLEAYEAARMKLTRSSLVLIDDTDVAYGGKGRLVIPAIIRDGFDPLVWGRQTLLLRLG